MAMWFSEVPPFRAMTVWQCFCRTSGNLGIHTDARVAAGRGRMVERAAHGPPGNGARARHKPPPPGREGRGPAAGVGFGTVEPVPELPWAGGVCWNLHRAFKIECP
eukprot:756762-Hanusia_phi.AAC.1